MHRRTTGTAPTARATATVFLLLTAALPAAAADAPGGAGAFESETRHSLTAEGVRLDYVARTGILTVAPGGESGTAGRMFFISYTKAGESRQRPLTFIFNGGPGAAAVYLHMGVMGPRQVTFADDGRVSDTTQVADNALSWLVFSDLVFVDPVGTGFSRAGGKDGGKSSDGEDGPSAFWATARDLDSLAAFIRLYLTRNERWLAPVVLAGESYGGFRVAALADRLQSRFDLSISGLVMISPALELGLLSDDRFRLVPWITRVPSFAAAARRHQRARTAERGVDAEALRPVERFAMETLLPAVATGQATGDDGEGAAGLARLADLIGLPADLVRRSGGRIPTELFAVQLLETEGRIVSLYDASISYPAPHPADGHYRDPRLARVSAAIGRGFNAEIRARLGVKTDLPYQVLNRKVSAKWTWREGRGRRGPPGAAENLEHALKTVSGLRALLVHGVYDLVTPYFASAYLVNQFNLTPEMRRRLVLRTYDGGHMFYTHSAARAAFYDDARRFYGEIAGAMN